jgi:hypothetical protein
MNIWFERLLRTLIDNKWGAWPAQVWDLLTVIGLGAVSAGFGWLWAGETDFTSGSLLVVLWGAAGLIFGWFYIVLRRPS